MTTRRTRPLPTVVTFHYNVILSHSSLFLRCCLSCCVFFNSSSLARLQWVFCFCLVCLGCLTSLLSPLHCNWSTNVFFCFQNHGELSLSAGEGAVEWVGTVKRGPSGKMGEGAFEWEESPGCQGVTSLDTTSSSPGNHRTPPRWCPPPLFPLCYSS